MNKYYYIYKTINITNERFYVGRHTSDIHPDRDSYLGSGIAINDAFISYGIKNFRREILEFCTKENINERETFWIRELDAVNVGYNITESSCGGILNTEGYRNRFLVEIECPHCGKKSFNKPMMFNIHLDNCIKNPNLDLEKFRLKREKSNEKLKITRDNLPIIVCEYCGFSSKNQSVISNYHGDNCSQNPNFVDRRELVTCPYCEVTGRGSGIRRYHGENCIHKPKE